MEYETWVQVLNQIYQAATRLKSSLLNDDLVYYAMYLMAYLVGRHFKIKELSLQNLLPLIMALFMCELVYSIMIDSNQKYPDLARNMKNASLIFFLFYVQCVVYFVKDKNLWTSLSCSLMCAYMLIRMEFWGYVEDTGQAFSQLLYDVHWLVIFLLHCFIIGSFLPKYRYSRAYKRLVLFIRGY